MEVRTLSALAEDSSYVPRTHLVTHKPHILIQANTHTHNLKQN